MPITTKKTIVFVAGDLSGDIHSGMLARHVRECHPEWTLHALGGWHLGREVCKSPDGHWLGDSTNCSAVGLLRSGMVYFKAAHLMVRLLDFLRDNPVDLLVLCDWGGFNRRLLKRIRHLAIPCLWFFPPRSWQKHGRQGTNIDTAVTRIATPFRWSADRLCAKGYDAEWVGHPVLETPVADRDATRRDLGLEPGDKLVALLPGSRPSELHVLAPRTIRTAKLLRRRQPTLKFAVVVPETLAPRALTIYPEWIPVVPISARSLLHACDAAVVKTGTITLEAAIAGTPSVAIYDFDSLGRFEWLLLYTHKMIPFIAMPNIILGRMAMRELLGPRCTPDKITDEIEILLTDSETRQRLLDAFAEVRQALGSDLPKSSTIRTTEIIEEMLAVRPRVDAQTPLIPTS